MNATEIAIVGAGVAGLTAARAVREAGKSVVVFDKGRGVGGRVSTRRTEDGLHFDHGAQFFSAREPEFVSQVERWVAEGVAAEWDARLVDVQNGKSKPKTDQPRRFVGTPGMNALAKALATHTDVRCSARVSQITGKPGAWTLWDDAGASLGDFSRIAVTAPAPQAAELLKPLAPPLAQRLASVEIAPCWAVMAAFDRSLELDFDGAFVHESALSWAARNISKPGRDAPEAWVLHGAPDWSTEHLELAPDQAAAALFAEFCSALRVAAQPAYLRAHRWRYALPTKLLDERCLVDAERGLAVGGDWCAGPRVEGAYLSGLALAKALA